MDSIPTEKKALRACLMCGLIKSAAQFKRDGCDNCVDLFRRINGDRTLNPERYTSASFAGMAAIMAPQKSWVAKWQRDEKFTRGLYALRVHGKLASDLEELLIDEGVKYRARDGSVQD